MANEEKIAEEFFPMHEKNIKNAIEKKKSKGISLLKPKKTVEKKKSKRIPKKDLIKRAVEKKSKKKIKTNSKIKKKKKEEYKIPNIVLKKNGYELIITEKPQAASKLAAALGEFTEKKTKKVSYYEGERAGKKIVIACAVGHLFGLKQTIKGTIVPTFEVDWRPSFLNKKSFFTKRYYDTILGLAKKAGSLTIATDLDIEGEVIGTNVVKFICNQKDASRMKFSTLTKEELNKAYDNKSESIDWGMERAGEARHYLDWFYGINLSRALMKAIQTTGKFKMMSIGRIQGPTLSLIVKREKEIQNFKPKKYWNVFIKIENLKEELKYSKDIYEEEELEEFKDFVGKEAEVQTKNTEKSLPPNPPFNLTGLQMEAYHLYSMTPANTLRVAQSLYLSSLISYPRTSSQKLPSSIDYLSILKTLKKRYGVSKLIIKDRPLEGKKTDSAHPSIYPTGNLAKLSGKEKKIYDLIVLRFLSLFCDNAIVERRRIVAKIEKKNFSRSGNLIKKRAWLEIYPTKIKEEKLPEIEGKKKIEKLNSEEKWTTPPNRYSPASILSELEKRNLGTKATRASILETLYDREYIKEKSIEATPIGISLIDTLERYSPIITDEKLTEELQKKMDILRESKTDLKEKEEEIIEQAKEKVIEISKKFKDNEKEIGKELMNAEIERRKINERENQLNVCPKCKKGNLRITYSPRFRKFFIACNAYPECKNTFSLPPGKIKTIKKLCEKCGFPLLMTLRPGKKPWIFCFNPECESNKERIEKYKKKLEETK